MMPVKRSVSPTIFCALSSRATRSLVTVGAFAVGLRTGSPVRALVESRDDGRRSRLGVSTTRSWSSSTRSDEAELPPDGAGENDMPLTR